MPLVLACLPLLALLSVAAVIDWRTRRIPNWLNLAMLVTGLANACAWGVPVGPKSAALGVLAGFGLSIVPHLIGARGAGDVKMLAAVGAWVGPMATLQVTLVGAIAGLIIVLVQCAASGRLTQLFSNSTLIVANFANYAQLGREQVIASGRSLKSVDKPLPYAVPTLIGVAVTLAMNPI